MSGFFTPGQLTALLGPSGSGKTVSALRIAGFGVLHLAGMHAGSVQTPTGGALLCPSAAQTLLDILSGRKNTGKIEGDVKFGGVKPTHAFLQRYTGFVEQFGEC